MEVDVPSKDVRHANPLCCLCCVDGCPSRFGRFEGMHWFLCKKDTDAYYLKKQLFTNSTHMSNGQVKPQVAVALIDAGWGDATPWSKAYLSFIAGKSRGGWKGFDGVRMLLFFFRRACAVSAHGCLGPALLSQKCAHSQMKYLCKECSGSKVLVADPRSCMRDGWKICPDVSCAIRQRRPRCHSLRSIAFCSMR